MRNLRNGILGALLVSATLSAATTWAAPAADVTVQLSQPGGVVFAAKPAGDEWNNRMETAAGFTVAKDKGGVWRYVTGFTPGKSPVFSSITADRPAPPGLQKHIQAPGQQRPQGAPGEGTSGTSASTAAPAVSSTSPVLFILTQFPNRAGLTSAGSWAGFVSNNIVDFFAKTSHGNANLLPANESGGPTSNDGVVGWVTMGYNHPNTAGNTGDTNRRLASDAIYAANSAVNFAAYDSNGNGYVDGDELSVVIIVAGYETAYGGVSGTLSPSVWGHKWGWSTGGSVPYPYVDGVRITEYAMFGELHATSTSDQHQATMGIMVHELGHLTYSLPDLYDTDGSSSGIGAFGVMSSGSWGAVGSEYSGETPVNASAWTKYAMNWVDDIEATGTPALVASGSSTATASNTVVRASSGTSSQYFLVENRQPQGYDLGLSRWLGTGFGGLAIWHVDDTRSNNASDSYRITDLEEADGTQMGSSRGSASDLWSNRTGEAFGASSTPNSNLNNGAASNVAMGNISASSTTMTLDIGAPAPPPPPEPVPDAPSAQAAADNQDGSATVSWNHNGANLTDFELIRQKAHRKRANSWTETVSLGSVSGSTLSIVDASGTGTFRWGVRALNGAQASSWVYTVNQAITDNGGDGGGGGGGDPQQCPVEQQPGASCTSNDQCCSNKCKGKPGRKTCA